MRRVTVLLAEDHMVVRQGLRLLLDAAGGIEVVGEATSGRDALRLAKQLQPDVVLMDIAMPDLNGFEATRQVLEAVPGTRVLVLSAHDDDAYVDHVVALGASGYLVKQSSAESLAKAVLTVGSGGSYFSSQIAKRMGDRIGRSGSPSGAPKRKRIALTRRERETLQLVAEGRANKEIASELGIAIKTVEKHRHNLMAKLGIHDTAGLTRYAIAQGIIEGGPQIEI